VALWINNGEIEPLIYTRSGIETVHIVLATCASSLNRTSGVSCKHITTERTQRQFIHNANGDRSKTAKNHKKWYYPLLHHQNVMLDRVAPVQFRWDMWWDEM